MSNSIKMKPISVIKTRLGIQENGPVHAFFTETCYKYMDKYVPMDKGNLRTIIDLQTNSITYEMPYAHAQYVGYTTGPVNPDNYTTPGTGPYWDKKMVSADMKQVENEVQEKFGGKL